LVLIFCRFSEFVGALAHFLESEVNGSILKAIPGFPPFLLSFFLLVVAGCLWPFVLSFSPHLMQQSTLPFAFLHYCNWIVENDQPYILQQ
jgi:hypothetical protein